MVRTDMIARLAARVNPLMDDMFDIQQTPYYQRHLLEQKEIDSLKWIESEKVGYDIGIERARWIWWTTGHRTRWIAAMRMTGTAGFI